MSSERPDQTIISTIIEETLESRAKFLGVNLPEGICVLPNGFFDSDGAASLAYPSTALDIKALFREKGLPVGMVERAGVKIPYSENRFAEWVGPVLAFGGELLKKHPEIVKDAISTIASYITTAFYNVVGRKKVKISVLTEDGNGKSRKIDFDGHVDELPEILKLIERQDRLVLSAKVAGKIPSERNKSAAKAKDKKKLGRKTSRSSKKRNDK